MTVAMLRISNLWRYTSVRCCHSGSVIKNDKLYELRTYNIWPQHVKEFLNLTTEEFHLRTSQSKLIGYWTSELGGINEVVHLWEYDNLSHRAEVRARLATNSEWIQRYFSKILPMMSKQLNSVLIPIPGFSAELSKENGIYQLITLQMKKNADALAGATELLLQNPKNNLLVGAFKTIHGDIREGVLLWKHPSLSAATDLAVNQFSGGNIWEKTKNIYSKILIPHKVSPLQ